MKVVWRGSLTVVGLAIVVAGAGCGPSASNNTDGGKGGAGGGVAGRGGTGGSFSDTAGAGGASAGGAGAGGSAGAAGTTGAAGSVGGTSAGGSAGGGGGTTGAGGTAGTTGTAGATSSGGTTGAGGGVAGAGGTTGSAGSGGTTGSAGTGGGAGRGGTGGVGGTGGAAGTGGVAGAGTGGVAGSTGTGGVAGSAGTGGVGGSAGTGGVGGTSFANRDVDVLFLVDDSSSMRLTQNNLVQSFPAFVTALKAAQSGMPNIHIAIISSDMGAGDGSVASCDSTGGKNGIFQYAPQGTCTASGLSSGATFISDTGGVKNYTGTLESVFTCIAAIGEQGCGFEHQFAAITRALGADGRGAAPAENQGFLRPDADLAIVMVTNEDDCSAAPGNGPNGEIPLYDTSANTNMASQLGPPANFRCNEFGHLCGTNNDMRPVRSAPDNNVDATVSYASCTSNDAEGYLLGVVDTANRLKALKANANKVIVAAITGPAAPYKVIWRAPSTADSSCGAASCPWPQIEHSCTATDGSFADPAVRIIQLANQFGGNGIVASICADSLATPLQTIAQAIVARLSP